MNRDCCCTANLACLLPVVCSGRVQFFPPPFTLHPLHPSLIPGRLSYETESPNVFVCWDLLLFSHSDVSKSLRSHGPQHARLPCPSPSPGVCSNSIVGDAIQPSHPLLSPSTAAFNFPSIKVFSNESALCIRWSKFWSFSISPSSVFRVNFL